VVVVQQFLKAGTVVTREVVTRGGGTTGPATEVFAAAGLAESSCRLWRRRDTFNTGVSSREFHHYIENLKNILEELF